MKKEILFRVILFFVLILLFKSCKSHTKFKSQEPKVIYDDSIIVKGKVVAIDSIKEFYLIYLKNDNLSYKIISEKKVSYPKCDKIQIDSNYNIRIRQKTFDVIRESNNSRIKIPVNHLDFAKCMYFNTTEICTELGYRNLFESINLNGLCVKDYK